MSNFIQLTMMSGKSIWIRSSDVNTIRRYGIDGSQVETYSSGILEVQEIPEVVIDEIKKAEA